MKNTLLTNMVVIVTLMANSALMAGESSYECTVQDIKMTGKDGVLVEAKIMGATLGKKFTISRKTGHMAGEAFPLKYNHHEILRAAKVEGHQHVADDYIFLYQQNIKKYIDPTIVIGVWDPNKKGEPIVFATLTGATVYSGTCQ